MSPIDRDSKKTSLPQRRLVQNTIPTIPAAYDR